MVSGNKSREPGATGNKFCTAVSKICGSWVWELLVVTILHLNFEVASKFVIYIYTLCKCIFTTISAKVVGFTNSHFFTACHHTPPIFSQTAYFCINPTPFYKIANISKAWISGARKSALTVVVFQENSRLNCCVFPDITLFTPAGTA